MRKLIIKQEGKTDIEIDLVNNAQVVFIKEVPDTKRTVSFMFDELFKMAAILRNTSQE